MKINSLKSGLLFLALFAAAAMTSCDKDDDDNAASELKEKIVGTWDISSFKVGGFEYMDVVIEHASLEYEAFEGTQGDFAQTVKYVDEDPEENGAGKYEVVSGNSIKMVRDGESYTMKVVISGDNIQLEGEQDGDPLVIKAGKRK